MFAVLRRLRAFGAIPSRRWASVRPVLLVAKHEAVRVALASLTVLERQAVRLSFYQNLTCVEAAAELGNPVPTLNSRCRDSSTCA